MKEILKQIPERSPKPRKIGLTMMMDKGLSIREAENFLETCYEHTDIVKLGFGTSILTPNIAEKIKLYKDNGMLVYPGGTLFEAFAIRNQLADYKKYLNKTGLNMLEISDGSMFMDHKLKCSYIQEFAKDFKVISEVGSKDSSVEISSENWIKWMRNELEAGSWKVIAEAREGGNVGVFDGDGGIKSELIKEITQHISDSDILWEAPNKNQQIWFIEQFGVNVNLGNISPNSVIPLECLRLGLRGDTFHTFLKK
jgi:phosphosulfolactate synthase|tara:strand:- start:261 stop:1022 length:762 start_codon:yes stop_codon:yes gene_type:complete